MQNVKGEDVIYLTRKGLEEKKERLAFLKDVERPRIIEDIKVAKGFGDLSENAEYDAAREEQAKTEKEIAELEKLIPRIKVAEIKLDGKAAIGKTMTFKNLEKDIDFTMTLVGPSEANHFKGRISTNSPVGKAILHKKVGDTFPVTSSTGQLWNYEVLKVEYLGD